MALDNSGEPLFAERYGNWQHHLVSSAARSGNGAHEFILGGLMGGGEIDFGSGLLLAPPDKHSPFLATICLPLGP